MQVILKPTLACNGTCVYCSAASTLHDQPTLPEERLGDLFRPLAVWLRADPTRSLGIIWHGGEPLILGLPYYRAVRREQERAFGADLARVKNQVQTNLTLLTPEWIPFFREFLQGSVGTSYDMVEGIRGLRSGEPLARRWLDAVRLCLDGGLRVGVLYVVHRLAVSRAREIYRFFRNLDPSLRIRVNPLYREGRAAEGGALDLAIGPEEYGRFLLEVLDEWWPERDRTGVLPLGEWYAAWRGDLTRLCCDSGGRCQETHLGICPDGGVYGCGRASDSLDPALCLGNVFADDLQAMLDHPTRRRLRTRASVLRGTRCRDCAYWAVCHGGCPMDGRIYHGDAMRETWFCAGRLMVFEEMERRLGPPPKAAGVFGGKAVEDLD